jgi:hypothetical protein
MRSKINFQFYNQIAPRYIQPLFLPLELGTWYSTSELKDIVQLSIDVEGKEIVLHNIEAWESVGLGETKIENYRGRTTYFRITKLGKQLQETYSTNQELFFELMHYLFYSPWKKTMQSRYGKFWVYSRASDFLWDAAPSQMDSFELAGVLQQEAQDLYIGYNPKFSVRSVTAVFPWLASLTPAFLHKMASQRQFQSLKRVNCSPQLFHLALDLIYNQKHLKYGTSMAIGDEEIKAICRVCLLDERQFWEMTDRTKMIIRGVDIRRGQFSTSIALDMKPQWIDLPDYANEIEFDGLEGDEE